MCNHCNLLSFLFSFRIVKGDTLFKNKILENTYPENNSILDKLANFYEYELSVSTEIKLLIRSIKLSGLSFEFSHNMVLFY